MQAVTKDLLIGVTVFALGLGALLYIQYGPGEALQTSRDAQITFRSFPSVISALLMLLSGIFVAVSLVSRSRVQSESGSAVTADETGKQKGPPYLALRMAGLLILLIAYAILLGAVPYYLLTAIFLFILFFIFGETNPLRNLIVAALGGAAFHGLFVMVLHLPLY